AVSAVFIDQLDEHLAREQQAYNRTLFAEMNRYSERVMFALGPHAIYTVSPDSLLWARDFAAEHDVPIHIHLAETEKEVEDCRQQHGRRPVEYLHDIGFLGPGVIAAHVIWVDPKEIDLLKEHGVIIVYNPTSNMKLGAGIFPYERLKTAGLKITLGTDGCASNNNLDMLEEMKFAALMQKVHSGNPALLPAAEAFSLATRDTYEVFNLEAGELRTGSLADLVLVDLENVHLIPHHNLLNNLVYSTHGRCIDTTICDGKVLMRNGVVEGEEEVKTRANEIAARLVGC
ncbi:MAG: amidohydrolase family protein, partial [Candidatus Neomarinimicrobiota bacterium]